MRCLRFARGVLDQAGKIGNALSGCKATDGTHGLFTVRGINPGTDGMGDDQARQQNKQGLSEQALRKKPVHSWLTAGVNM